MARLLGRYRHGDGLGLRGRDQVLVRDQGGEADPEGSLLCRITPTGSDTWVGHDAKGRALRVTRGRDNALEVREDITGEHPGAVAGPVAWGRGSDPAAAATGGSPARSGDSALAAWQRSGDWQYHGRGLADYQRAIDRFYGSKQ